MTPFIKNYQGWLFEAEQAATAPAPMTPDGVLFASAGASASNVTDNLMAQIGVKANTLYSFTVKSMGQLKYIYDDGKKFGGQNFNSKTGAAFPTEGTKTAAGDDTLTINGKTIKESGTLIITSNDIKPGTPVQIQASGNGLLVLVRLAEAFGNMTERYKFTPWLAKDWIIKLSLGGNVKETDSRGFSYWYAKPGTLGPASNQILAALSINLLNQTGNKEAIAVSDSVFGQYFNLYVNGKDGAGSVQTIADAVSKGLTGQNMLTTQPAQGAGDAWKALGDTAAQQKLITYDQRKKKFTLTQDGATKLIAVADAIATAIAPKQPPAGFGAESQFALSAYANIIKSGLTSRKDIANWFDTVQVVQNWQAGGAPKGAAGQGKTQQKEGQF